ncbi:response regulator transcription factor [Pseudoduganella lutea]|uniref:Response regulator transcription factor n=1 Tax=Pseudoduganella lutea TaxID=321985 RepID=A0A4P6L4K8_9BURK|nr:response regulator transcription factor [Pseudoduganella lutea]QBE66407.1 response regulator transcription factor [Pseudoduganella lutea]
MQLLLVEDDEILATGMASLLRLSGFAVEHAPNGAVAEFLLTRHHFDAVILDLGLPLVDGPTVLQKLRASGDDLPVLVLTALDRLDSRITLLNAGADDYITKPVDFYELEARLRAVLRRSAHKRAAAPTGHGSSTSLAGPLRFDRDTRRAVSSAGAVEFSPRETILLDLLLANAERVVTKEQIIAAWAKEGLEVGQGNAIEVHMHRLRRKLDNSSLSIKTIRGLGYLLEGGAECV